MGPSGAGKSTFLDAICQRTARATGEVRPLTSSLAGTLEP